MREPRKRINYTKKGLPAIEDEKEYKKNKCSQNARQVKAINSNLLFDVWFDKHYQIRQQFGDEAGVRLGIEWATVESLVTRAMDHLVAYGAILKTFTFINHELNGGRAIRIVLQEDTDNGMLNVVIEAHWIDVETYEITVITAKSGLFDLSDGQFAIEIIENESILKQLSRGQIKEIYNL